jgi:hypothetical protein
MLTFPWVRFKTKFFPENLKRSKVALKSQPLCAARLEEFLEDLLLRLKLYTKCFAGRSKKGRTRCRHSDRMRSKSQPSRLPRNLTSRSSRAKLQRMVLDAQN